MPSVDKAGRAFPFVLMEHLTFHAALPSKDALITRTVVFTSPRFVRGCLERGLVPEQV